MKPYHEELRAALNVIFNQCSPTKNKRVRRLLRIQYTSYLIGHPISSYRDLNHAELEELRDLFIPKWTAGQRVDVTSAEAYRLEWMLSHLDVTDGVQS